MSTEMGSEPNFAAGFAMVVVVGEIRL